VDRLLIGYQKITNQLEVVNNWIDKQPTMVEMHIQNVGGCAFRKVEKCSGCTKTLSILLHGFYFFSNMTDPNC